MNDKVVLVTGSTGGIGRAILKKFAEEEVRLAGVDLKEFVWAEDMGPEPDGQFPVTSFVADLSQFAAIEAVFAEIISKMGHVDVLINCAGVVDMTRLRDIDLEEWDRVLDINLKGTFFMSQFALAAMIENGRGGRIINLASLAGEHGGAAVGAHYSASKAGVISLTKSFAKVGGRHGITVNSISPGLVKTEMINGFSEKLIASMIAATPLERICMPEDVANVAYFLAGEDSSYVNGQDIKVNGGYI